MRERILFNDDRETKHQSRLIPKDVMRVSLSVTAPRLSNIARGK